MRRKVGQGSLGHRLVGHHLVIALLTQLFAQTAAESAVAAPRGAAGPDDTSTKELITPPKPVATPVEYPRGEYADTEVMLAITVRADGSVTDAEIISGTLPFTTYALEAVRSWQFEPALRSGRPVPSRIRYTLHFVPPRTPAVGGSPEGSPSPGQSALPAESSGTEKPAGPATPPAEPYEVTIHGVRAPPSDGSVRITRGEAHNLPGAFGDPLRAIEAQPGVVPIVSGLPSFFIRGAPPANVGFFIDGVEVPLLYHAFLGPSVLHPSIIESVDIYRGSAPVEYGRFAGPVVEANLTSIEPRWRGEGSLRVIDVGALAQAPLGDCDRSEDPYRPCSSVRLSGRYSYTGLVLSLFSNARLDYWDYQGQVNYVLGAHDTVSVLGFGAYDFFDAGGATPQDQGGGRVQFHRVDLRYDHKFSSDARLRVALTGGYDRTAGVDDTRSAVSDRSVRLRTELVSPIGSSVTLRSGADVKVDKYGLETNPLLLNFPDYTVLFPKRTDAVGGAHLGAEWRPTPGVAVRPGIRADVYSETGTTAVGVDPRISAAFAVHRNVSVESSFGVAHQLPGFAAQVPAAQVADLKGGLQEAWLWSSGVKWTIPSAVTLSANVFQSAYFNALDPIGGARDFGIDRTVLGRRSTIMAKGLELQISRSLTRKLGGFVSYTFSRSEEIFGRVREVSGFDRPHVLQAALSYDLGAGLRAGVRSIIYSGVPELNYEGSPHFVADRRGTPYFRLDARLEKRWSLGQSGYWAISAEVLNATSTREVVRLDCGTVCVQRYAGPIILPSVGIEAGF